MLFAPRGLAATCGTLTGRRAALCTRLPRTPDASPTLNLRHTSEVRNKERVKLRAMDVIDLTFLGTGSGEPSPTRNQQSLLLRSTTDAWLFDCGEGAQHRLMFTNHSPADIKRIFISHLHGDHVLGLPGLLCAMASKSVSGIKPENAGPHSAANSRDAPLQIVGPFGLRTFLYTALQNTYASMAGKAFQVHELAGFRHKHHRRRQPAQYPGLHQSEVPGQTIFPEPDGSWVIPIGSSELPFSVRAVELNHTVPTVGWVLTEEPRPGKLNPQRVMPLLRQHNLRRSMLSQLKLGHSITLPNGEVIKPEDHVDQSTQRKLVILSDTRDVPRRVYPHARNASLVVHESTNACLSEDLARGSTIEEVETHTRSHGHSTPHMAGQFAQNVNAKHLVLTHFSTRYPGDSAPRSVNCQNEIIEQAQSVFKGSVTTARDFLVVSMAVDGTISEQIKIFARPTDVQDSLLDNDELIHSLENRVN